MTQLEKDLIAFAKLTLATLELDEEWSSDTADVIAEIAFNLKLANPGTDGMFHSTVD